jgi:hypothetical protein
MTYLSFNFANWVTVILMVLVLYGVLALAQQGVVKLQQSQAGQ